MILLFCFFWWYTLFVLLNKTPVISYETASQLDYFKLLTYQEKCWKACDRMAIIQPSLWFWAYWEYQRLPKPINDEYYKSLLHSYKVRDVYFFDNEIVVYPLNIFHKVSTAKYILPLSDTVKRRMECNQGSESYATYINCKKSNTLPLNIPDLNPRLWPINYWNFFPDQCPWTFLQRGEDIASYRRLLSGNVFTIHDIYSGSDLQDFIDKELAKDWKTKYDRCFGSVP